VLTSSAEPPQAANRLSTASAMHPLGKVLSMRSPNGFLFRSSGFGREPAAA
jgi:hypothetical protein